ncbi:Amidase signature (AS) enzyme [Glarea lozoyensis ATCC 20868]|uniref:amidase n=1 Tax=Glarea lozoyensis (strain ATCC 20868 / MF5171) TaxID=1116229 RepID=S3CTU4_GLAL2|nr:Amidase signature (AS) enzyme [Glarea lozoyensis ATCC 20868]EPE29787.1 Amidase signature (AS) enzyme [Glarea lozoyensis ATCC 20868]
MAPSGEPPYLAIAARKQAEQKSRIPKEWLLDQKFVDPPQKNVLHIPRASGILTDKELHITESYSAVALTSAIAKNELTALAVTTAFCKRAAIAQQLTNCLTEIMFEDAIARAKWLDSEFQKTGKVVGPLHGLPISLKDSFKVKGYDASIGIASLAFNPATQNSVLVDILLDLGAVVYVKTNIPQTLMALDSHNHLFGRTLNPRNRDVTAGGSSGGEGALIAMKGSILGVGTDVGGSIRIPAMCNGLVGVKPSVGRVPFMGQEGGGRPGMGGLGMQACAGPLGRDVSDCEFFLRTLADAKPWEQDPAVVFGAFDSQGSMSRKPIIGVLRSDGIVRPLPPIAKVLDETSHALRTAGVEVVEIPNDVFKKCNSLANKFFGIDGANFVLDLLEKTGEPLSPWLQNKVARKEQVEVNTLASLRAEREELEREMLGVWRTGDGRVVDVVVCPVAGHPTPGVDGWNGVGYTSSWVLLDCAAGTIPVRDFSHSDPSLEFKESETVLGNSWDEVNRGMWNGGKVDRQMYLDTTLCVQVVAPRLQEKRLVEGMKLVEDAVARGKEGGKREMKL